MKVYLLLFFCLCFMFGCAEDKPELEISIINEEDTPNYHYYDYSVQVREKGRVCDVYHLEVTVELLINGSVSYTNRYDFQRIAKGKTSVKSDSIRTYGREASDEVTFNFYQSKRLETTSKSDIPFLGNGCSVYGTDPRGRPYNGEIVPTS